MTEDKLPELNRELKKLRLKFDEAVDGEAHYTDIDRILNDLENVQVRIIRCSGTIDSSIQLSHFAHVWYGLFKKLYRSMDSLR